MGGSAVVLAKSPLKPQAVAQNTTNEPHQQRGERGGWMRDLQLTPQQMETIKHLPSQNKQAMSGQKQALRQAQEELRNLMAGDASPQQIRSKYNQVKVLKQQIADAQFENKLAIGEVLNSTQRQQFVQRMEQRRGKFRQQP